MLNKLKIYFQRMRATKKAPPRRKISEIAWSGLGAFVALYTISYVTQFLNTNPTDGLFLIGSFGASAILIYGAPHLDFSQPRNFIGGHIISTFVGVLVYKYLHFDIAILSAIAVSLSLVAMHLTATMHPPGGATALIAIIGTQKIHELGFHLIFSPILVLSTIMLVIALIINNMSKNEMRHYPRYWW